MNKKFSSLLAALLAVSLLAGCAQKSAPPTSPAASAPAVSGAASQPAPEPAADVSEPEPEPLSDIKLTVLSGPTGVGAAQLLSREDLPFRLESSVVAANDEVTAALVNGDADVAAIATNVAANLCAKTNGGIQVLCINTLGVLYILEKGDTVHSMADLQGKTVYATGQGANPEYVLNHLLTENGVDPAQVDIQWMTAQEVTANMASSDSAICMLPVPAATGLLIQDAGVREALSLSDEWDKLGQGQLAMGCLVARTAYLEENPQMVEALLGAYQESISFMSDEANREDAAKLVVQYGIAPNEKVAAQAIPQCNLTFLTGQDMQAILQTYYGVLCQANPGSIGGSVPADSFYYGLS